MNNLDLHTMNYLTLPLNLWTLPWYQTLLKLLNLGFPLLLTTAFPDTLLFTQSVTNWLEKINSTTDVGKYIRLHTNNYILYVRMYLMYNTCIQKTGAKYFLAASSN